MPTAGSPRDGLGDNVEAPPRRLPGDSPRRRTPPGRRPAARRRLPVEGRAPQRIRTRPPGPGSQGPRHQDRAPGGTAARRQPCRPGARRRPRRARDADRRRSRPRPARAARPLPGGADGLPGRGGRRRLAAPGRGGCGVRAVRRDAHRPHMQPGTRWCAERRAADRADPPRRLRRLRRRGDAPGVVTAGRAPGRRARGAGRPPGARSPAVLHTPVVRAVRRPRVLARPGPASLLRAARCCRRVAARRLPGRPRVRPRWRVRRGPAGRRGRRPGLAARRAGARGPLRPRRSSRCTTYDRGCGPGSAGSSSTARAARRWRAGMATTGPPQCWLRRPPSPPPRCSHARGGRLRSRLPASPTRATVSAGGCRPPPGAAGSPSSSPRKACGGRSARRRACSCVTGGRSPSPLSPVTGSPGAPP